MTVRDIQHILESWAPKEIAWERDNVGLLIGTPNHRVRNILVSLDVTDEIVDEARAKRIDLIISHHPLLFHSLKTIRGDDRVGRIVTALIHYGIALYAAHTNLDFTQSGVSFTLAERLKLQHIDFLQKNQSVYQKIVVFVPADHADTVMASMAQAGAGVIGKYERCSFRTEGVGTFKAADDSKPFIGKAGQFETVPEIRLEMILPQWKMNDVLTAMRSSHPYEEVAYDVYGLSNESNSYGAGAIGDLEKEINLKTFLGRVRTLLNTGTVRYTGKHQRRIKRVAVCGGSGSDLLRTAIQQGADAFITADVSYHTFQEADGRIALVDAGHFETEQPIVQKIVQYLHNHCASVKEKIYVVASTRARNPVQYYLS